MKSLSTVFYLLAVVFTNSPAVHALQTVKPLPTASTALTHHPSDHPLVRPKWGVDKDHPEEYWFDQRIHSLGNVGLSGALHAAVAPAFTKLIDWKAYDDIDIRKQLAERLSKSVKNQKARVVDLCCGVGFSTRALKLAFQDAEVFGIDTSKEMIAMAKFITSHIQAVRPYFGYRRQHCLKQTEFATGNAEQTNLEAGSFDLVTVMYAFHEAPKDGRDAILKEAKRLLKVGGTLAVVDISTDYKPTKSMLMGEPYVQEYQANIHRQLRQAVGFTKARYETVIPNHLGMWTLRRTAIA